jgi:DNA-binding XRE family transcriptional regulator
MKYVCGVEAGARDGRGQRAKLQETAQAVPGKRQTPTVRLRRLAAELRSLRAASGLTREEVVERTGINSATMYRIEHARVCPQTRTLRTLLDLYGMERDQQADLVELLRDARERGWLHPYQSELPEQ